MEGGDDFGAGAHDLENHRDQVGFIAMGMHNPDVVHRNIVFQFLYAAETQPLGIVEGNGGNMPFAGRR